MGAPALPAEPPPGSTDPLGDRGGSVCAAARLTLNLTTPALSPGRPTRLPSLFSPIPCQGPSEMQKILVSDLCDSWSVRGEETEFHAIHIRAKGVRVTMSAVDFRRSPQLCALLETCAHARGKGPPEAAPSNPTLPAPGSP